MKKVKVLNIIKSLGRGGAETLLVETLKAHDKERFEFYYIYFLPWKDQLAQELRQAGGVVHCIPAHNNIQLISKVGAIVRFVRENKIDIVHAHLPWAGLVAKMAGKMIGTPVIYSEHNKQERYHFVTRFLNLVTLNWARVIVPVSQDVELSIRKNKRRITTHIETVPNGVNVTYFAPQDADHRDSLGIPDDAIVISTIAVFRTQKRLERWLELASQIHSRRSGARFMIIGDGPLRPLIEQKRKSLQLNDVVNLPGLQTDVRPYLAATDIYMITSEFEGLPIALLEAMASGLPVITTNAGGIKEVVVHGHNGLMCDVAETPKLVDFAINLIDNENLRKQYGAAGRDTVKRSFGMEQMVANLERLYTYH